MVATSPDPVEIPADSPPQTRQQKKRRIWGIARTDTPAARRPLSEEDTSPTDEGSATNHDASTDLISDDEDSATSPSDTPTPQRQRLQRSDTSSTNASTSASAEAQRLGVDASTRILKRHTPAGAGRVHSRAAKAAEILGATRTSPRPRKLSHAF